MHERLIVSACLLGHPCRYDGGSKPAGAVERAVAEHEKEGGEVFALCPEELGGLGTPRPAAELRGGDGLAVLEGRARVERLEDGGDVTERFLAGATEAWRRGEGASRAILKARSPSCGCGEAHRDGAARPGDGVFAALLRHHGVLLQTDEDLS
jgi:uncharacterized protein YbbK (DUF523 family)